MSKEFYLCKLCLVVFGALLAMQSAFAKDKDGVWYCYSETDVAALPGGVYEANPYTRKWTVKRNGKDVDIDDGQPSLKLADGTDLNEQLRELRLKNGEPLSDYQVRSESEYDFEDDFYWLAISRYFYTTVMMYPNQNKLVATRLDGDVVSAMHFKCSKF